MQLYVQHQPLFLVEGDRVTIEVIDNHYVRVLYGAQVFFQGEVGELHILSGEELRVLERSEVEKEGELA